MASDKHDGNGPHPADESDRGLLIGLSEGSGESEEGPDVLSLAADEPSSGARRERWRGSTPAWGDLRRRSRRTASPGPVFRRG